jgi:hypothetical protein
VGRKEQAVELSSEMFEVAKTLPLQDTLRLVFVYTAHCTRRQDRGTKLLKSCLMTLSSAENIKETYVKALVFAQLPTSMQWSNNLSVLLTFISGA